MPSRLLQRAADASRDRATFWLTATALVLAQLLAFWMLCSHQVRKAEVRHASLQADSLAIADCMRYVPGATLTSCTLRVAPLARGPEAVNAQNGVTGSAVPAPAVAVNQVNR